MLECPEPVTVRVEQGIGQSGKGVALLTSQ